MSVVRQTPKEKVAQEAKVVLGLLEHPGFQPFLNEEASYPVLVSLRAAQFEIINQSILNGLDQPICLVPDAVLPPSQANVPVIARNLINDMADVCRSYLAKANAIPAPSSYAQHNTWVEWQDKETAILCFRPNGRQGLPLCVLDNVFRKFQQQATAALPSSTEAAQATSAAFNLCRRMPDHFKTETGRSEAFDECVVPLFQIKWWREQFYIQTRSELHKGQVDRAYEHEGMVCILREDKLEMDTGDPYMQVARAYQLYAEKARNENRNLAAQGAPLFLLCLLGPILLICGGFHDGKSAIVEPLAEPCLLFDDFLHHRQEVLARQLFALKEAVVALRNRPPVVDANVHVAGVPRVYKTYLAADNNEPELRWLSPLAATHRRSLLIIATEDPNAKDPNAVRLVKLVRKYGDEVHQLLAKSGFAPKLYGHRSLEGAPTAYVMEYLNPSTDATPGWKTLWDFFESYQLATRYMGVIEKTLNDILAVMEAASVVHGDLRPNNIMLEVGSDGAPVGKGEGVNLKVVDFDWAGRTGDVNYPLQRNEGIKWPAGPGTPIVVAHDRTLVEGWWCKRFSSDFPGPRMVE